MLSAASWKFRRIGAFILLVTISLPLSSVIFMNGPDLSQEQLLQHRLADLRERLHHAEMLNQERRKDILLLREQLNLLLSQSFSSEARQLLGNYTGSSLDLQVPSIYHVMPHLLGNPTSLIPIHKVAKGRTGVSMVLGVPTVKREVQSYLVTTIQNLIENMNQNERDDSVIIVFIAELDLEYIRSISEELENEFAEYIEIGLLEIVAPPPSFYPDLNKLKPTLGDPLDRTKWRTKQNLDFAFLMMYAQTKGTFYVQLEDDILTKKGYISTMKKFALHKISEKRDWFILDFCQLGFIGKMFKTSELENVVLFLLMFHADKPSDWLLVDYITTRTCRFDKDAKHCKKAKELLWLHYKPSLFQHVGIHSSLKGKVQKLKDKQFGKLQLHTPHANPSGKTSTNLKAYKTYSLEKAYKGETFFWGLLPQSGDWIGVEFNPPVILEKYTFRSGNVEHPNDKFYNTSVEVLPVNNMTKNSFDYSLVTSDNYITIGRFNENGVAQGKVEPSLGPLRNVRLKVQSDSDSWVILSEIHLVPAAEVTKRTNTS